MTKIKASLTTEDGTEIAINGPAHVRLFKEEARRLRAQYLELAEVAPKDYVARMDEVTRALGELER